MDELNFGTPSVSLGPCKMFRLGRDNESLVLISCTLTLCGTCKWHYHLSCKLVARRCLLPSRYAGAKVK